MPITNIRPPALTVQAGRLRPPISLIPTLRGPRGLPGSAGDQVNFSTLTFAKLSKISEGAVFVRTAGFELVGDGGGALYRRVLLEPAHGGKFQSADGAWWELAEAVRDIRMYGARGDGTSDDTDAFLRACALPGVLRVGFALGAWVINQTVPVASGLTIQFIDRPFLRIEASGNKRGLWFPFGTVNSHIRGDARIELTVNVGGDDGSYNCAIGFGEFYVSSDPQSCDSCSVVGDILVDSVGSANGKPVHAYGYTTRLRVEGVKATGRTNFAFSTHWSGNGTPGVLPTKTWHPDQIEWIDCEVIGRGAQTLRAFTASAGGRVHFIRCKASDVPTLGFNLFVGDYGFTYAQNLRVGQAMQHIVEDCEADNCGILFTVVGTSTNLNGSPTWAGCDRGANVHFKGLFRGRSTQAHVGDLGGVSGVASFVADNLDIVESSPTGQGGDLIKITATRYVNVRGSGVVGRGPLVRNCGVVDWFASLKSKEAVPQSGANGVSASAVSSTTTTIEARAAGAMTIPLSLIGVAVGTGPGCYLQYQDGATTHEVGITTYERPNATNVTLGCDPLPVAIPDGASVTLVATVRNLNIDECVLDGFAADVRTTGSATAKVRSVNLGTKLGLLRWANIGADLNAINGGDVQCRLDEGGLSASGVKYGVSIGALSEGIRVAPKSGRKNQRIRYVTYIADGAKDCLLDSGTYLSYDAAAISPAAIYVQPASTTNIKIGSNNLYAVGMRPQFPVPA